MEFELRFGAQLGIDDDTCLVVVKNASEQAIVDLAQQLTWTGAAFRGAVTGHVELSVAKIESFANAYQSGCFVITFDNREILEGEEKCWYPLVSAFQLAQPLFVMTPL